MNNARERQFYWLLVIAILAVALVVVARTAYDALASPKAVVAMLDDRAQLEKARKYNRRLERELHQAVSRAERNERNLIRSRRATRRALDASPIGSHWLEVAFLCIYQYERGAAGWGTATGNGYEGGLQFDRDFQLTYGRPYLRAFGDAYNWPRSVQIAVAINAWTTRGFTPWPNTRKRCGL